MWGFNADPTKRIMIVHPENTKARKRFGAHYGLKMCMGARYLSGYIWCDKSKRSCLKKTTEKWEKKIHAATKTAGKYPQKGYTTVVHAI